MPLLHSSTLLSQSDLITVAHSMLAFQLVGWGAWTWSCIPPHASADAFPDLAMSRVMCWMCFTGSPSSSGSCIGSSLWSGGPCPSSLRDLCCPTLSAPGRRDDPELMVPFAHTATKQNHAFSVVLPLVLHLLPRNHSES